MIDFLKSKRPSSILGLSLEGNRLEAVVLRRNGTLRIQQTVTAPLALSPLTGDPELVGREIRNHLDQAGIRERRCAVCIPLSWVLTLQTKLPDLPEADVASFLEIEAERGFPSGQETLLIATSRSRAPAGESYAMQMGIPRNHLAILEKVLKAAQLKPLTFALGVAALQSPGTDAALPLLALALTGHGIDLQVTAGGGIVALRSLDGALEGEGAQKQIDADLAARELRVTVGQLPGPFAEALRKVKVFGRGDTARKFVQEITPRAQSMGLQIELVEQASSFEFSQPPAPEIVLSPALALAANLLTGVASGPNFLPPKVHPWQQFIANRFSSRKLAWASAAAAILLLGVGGVFGVQHWKMSGLESKWAALKPQVEQLKNDQEQIRKFRPWFDESYRSLRILKAIAQAFPEEGSLVSAKTLEIHELAAVTCSGTARDNQSYFRVLDELRRAQEITDVKTDTVRGQNPLQFSFSFQWEGGKASAN